VRARQLSVSLYAVKQISSLKLDENFLIQIATIPRYIVNGTEKGNIPSE